MNNWFIPIRNDKFNIEDQFNDYSFIEQNQAKNCSFEQGDFAYIYCTEEQELKYKCKICLTDIPLNKAFDDEKYVKDKEFFEDKNYKSFMRLCLVSRISIDLKTLQNNGINQFNIQRKIPDKLMKYLDSKLIYS